MTRGLLDAGIEVIAGFDCDDRCQLSYEYNNPRARFIHVDIREIEADHPVLKHRSGRYDDILFAGCAPCQPFSSQYKQSRQRCDTTLLGEFGRLVEAMLPGYVLIENVPGISRVGGFSTFRRFLRMLNANEYKYDCRVLDVKHYGVPQNRRRLVLLAMRYRPSSLPEPKYGNKLRPFRTVRQAISHFPAIAAGECHSRISNHVAASITDLNLERLRSTPHDGGDRNSWPKKLRLECHTGDYKGHIDVYGRMRWDYSRSGPHRALPQHIQRKIRSSRTGQSNFPTRSGRHTVFSRWIRIFRFQHTHRHADRQCNSCQACRANW